MYLADLTVVSWIEPRLQMTTNMAGHCTQTQVRYVTLPLGKSARARILSPIGSSGPLLLSHWSACLARLWWPGLLDLMNTKTGAVLAPAPCRPGGQLDRAACHVTSVCHSELLSTPELHLCPCHDCKRNLSSKPCHHLDQYHYNFISSNKYQHTDWREIPTLGTVTTGGL